MRTRNDMHILRHEPAVVLHPLPSGISDGAVRGSNGNTPTGNLQPSKSFEGKAKFTSDQLGTSQGRVQSIKKSSADGCTRNHLDG